MDKILLALARKEAHLHLIKITTSELGGMLGMSQQNASRRLELLEKQGLIERTRGGISITQSGIASLHSAYSDLKSILERKPIHISGTIVSGLGEGKYYLSFAQYRSQIASAFGFEPYAGTLNVKLLETEQTKKSAFVRAAEPHIISGFKAEGRSFGDLFAYACTVDGIPSALIIPSRTHHPEGIIELVAQTNLKKTLGKKDGDSVSVDF